LGREEAIMRKVMVAAAFVAVLAVPVLAPVLAADADERRIPARDAALDEILTPRPGAVIRDTVGTASAQPPRPGRVSDDRLIVEERPPSVSPQNCLAAGAPAACPR
jgi:hypothetical protein